MANTPAEHAVDAGIKKDDASARKHGKEEEEEEEYVLLDLEGVFHGAALPSNCAYTLSGLDTMNPVLTLGDELKLIGEYEETVGTVLVFTKHDEEVPEEERIHGSKENGKRKRVSNLCKVEKKLKFRIVEEKENEGPPGQELRSRSL